MPAQGNPTPPLVGGNSVRETILEGYVFQSGIHKPEHSSILTYKYPQYYLNSLLDRMGAEESTSQETFSWNIMDRTREGSTVLSVDAGGTGATATLTTNFDWTATSKGYLIVGDLIRIESGAVGRVTATADSGATPGKQEIDVVRQEGGNWSATLVSATDAFGHVGSSFGEASSAPEGRLYLPTEEYNNMHILRRSTSISGTELTNKTYLNDGSSWYFEVEDIEMKEFTRDKEAVMLFGLKSDSGVKSTRGLWDYVTTYGVNNGFAAGTGVVENDIQEHIKDLLIQNVSNEMYVLCGATILADIQRALKDYAIDGAMSYGTLGDNTAGLDFTSYMFMGKKIHFVYYELFEDQAIVPTPVNGVSATQVDFSNTSLWLDLGSENNGKSLITLKYKALGNVNRKFVHGYEVGMTNPNGQQGGMVSSGDDKFTIHYLCHFGLEVRLPNRQGVLRATS